MTTQRQDADSICCYYFHPGGYVSKQGSESGVWTENHQTTMYHCYFCAGHGKTIHYTILSHKITLRCLKL